LTRGTHQVAAFAAGLGALALAHPLLAGPPSGGELPGLAVAISDFLGLGAARDGLPWLVATLYVFVALLGGIAPDLDKPRGLWTRVLSEAMLGGHRHLSHSLVGAVLVGLIARGALSLVAPLLTFPAGLLWLGFMAGYVSHLVMDSLTREGVPWLYPWQVYLGLPPAGGARIRTGGWIEQLVVTPALLTFIGWLGYRQGYLLASLWR
jgi:inner membrane protein